MSYVVFDAGAIGAVVGGRLFQAGCDVTLIARGAHLEALRRESWSDSRAHANQLASPPTTP